MRQGAASTGKLGETFRGNRFFLFTREATAHGRVSDDAIRVCKHGFRRNADNTVTATTKQPTGGLLHRVKVEVERFQNERRSSAAFRKDGRLTDR
jgi:hypothetical protein